MEDAFKYLGCISTADEVNPFQWGTLLLEEGIIRWDFVEEARE